MQLSLYPQDKPTKTVRIEFDGGTPCNIPSRGYGIGYGSYRIDREPVVRLNFGIPMSANAAEIRTVTEAVKAAKARFGGGLRLDVFGDSQVALKWVNVCAGNRKRTNMSKCSPAFIDAIDQLSAALFGVQLVATQWQPRRRSVETFGH